MPEELPQMPPPWFLTARSSARLVQWDTFPPLLRLPQMPPTSFMPEIDPSATVTLVAEPDSVPIIPAWSNLPVMLVAVNVMFLIWQFPVCPNMPKWSAEELT